MNLISTLKMTALSTALLLVGCSSVSMVNSSAIYSKPRTLNNFNDYVQFLKGKAVG